MKLRSICFLLIVFISLTFTSLGSCASSDVAPLPNDILISPPNPSVDPNLAKLSGKWTGRLNFSSAASQSGTNHVLVVENFTATGATIIFAHAEVAKQVTGGWTRYTESGYWKRVRANWDAEKHALLVTLPLEGTRIVISYSLNSDGTLGGVGDNGSDTLRAILTRDKAITPKANPSPIPAPAEEAEVKN